MEVIIVVVGREYDTDYLLSYILLKHCSQYIFPTFLRITCALPIGVYIPVGGVLPMIANKFALFHSTSAITTLIVG